MKTMAQTSADIDIDIDLDSDHCFFSSLNLLQHQMS